MSVVFLDQGICRGIGIVGIEYDGVYQIISVNRGEVEGDGICFPEIFDDGVVCDCEGVLFVEIECLNIASYLICYFYSDKAMVFRWCEIIVEVIRWLNVETARLAWRC